MLTVLDVVQRSAAFLEGKGVESARLNAEWLICSALGIDRMKLYMQFDRPLTDAELAGMRARVARRGRREPLQYVLGSSPFHDLTLKVDRRALIPRSETEQLVELALSSAPDCDAALDILDLGTGSGAIILALAKALPQGRALGVDASAEALELARENAELCDLQSRVEFLQSDWFEQIDPQKRFDLIVSNPPYLTAEEYATAQPEVRDHEPRSALVAPEEGLAALAELVREALPRLRPGGSLWLETGIAHRQALLALCQETGYATAEGLDDWSGRERFIHAVAPG